MKANDKKIKRIALIGMFAAVIGLLTFFVSIPLPVGSAGAYLNAGDAAVYLSAYVLGPVGGALASAIGSTLADVLHGAAMYAPATFIIKGLMGLVCGLLLKRLRGFAPAIAGLIMPAGYFAYEYLVLKAGAVYGLWTNAIQYVFGVISGVILIKALGRVMKREDESLARDTVIKADIVRAGRSMIRDGLTTGTGGNVSVFDRERDLVFITPTTLPYDKMKAADIPVFRLDGTPVETPREPSMELQMHLNIYRARGEVNAVVHTHSPALKALADKEENSLSLPAAPEYPVGSPELAEGCAAHLGDFPAVLLRGHGAVAVGRSLNEAYGRAKEYEKRAKNL